MLCEFYKRGLYKTIDFLRNVGYGDANDVVSFSSDDLYFLNLFNLKEYVRLAHILKCRHFQPGKLVFCDCHPSNIIFLRNYSLLIDNPEISEHESHCVKDEFMLYLEALITKNNSHIVRKAISMNEAFWEAYLLLNDTIAVSTEFGKKMLNLYHMHLYATKGIDLKFEIDYTYPNLAAAVLCVMKEYDKGAKLFESYVFGNGLTGSRVPQACGADIHVSEYRYKSYGILGTVCRDEVSNGYEVEIHTGNMSLDYIDLYSNILYLRKDPRLSALAQKVLKINKYRGETYMVIGNYYSMKKDHDKAIECFLKAIDLDSNYSVIYTLVGHEFMNKKNVVNAIKYYAMSVKACPMDFRAWFGIAQAYSSIRMYEYSLTFYRRSVELRPNDGFLWMTMGRVYGKLKKGEAFKCYARAIKLKEIEAYLYSADLYKSLKKYTEAVKLYERYVMEGGKDSRRIKEFLHEYFTRIGNRKKSDMYKEAGSPQ